MMADILPKLMVMKPGNYSDDGGYAGYTEGGDVFCQVDKAILPPAKIEVERAGDGENVHLRFYHSNKYWAQSVGDDRNWIVAISNQREEDPSKLGCTLFKPSIVNMLEDGGINILLLKLTHVQSGLRVRIDSRSNRVYVGDDGDDDAFSFVDWDKLLKIPKRVTFKVAANYLEAVGDGTWDLQFSGSDGKRKNAAFVVHWQPDGHLRLESELLTGKFWRRASPDNWILLAANTTGADANTLFWPQKIDSGTISLVCNGNGNGNVFCGRMSKKGANFDCLNAAAAVSQVTDKARLVVEELVLNRNISVVQYQTQDARVFDEEPNLFLGQGVSYNPSDKKADVTVPVQYQDAPSYYFTNDFSMNTQVPFVIQAHIPTIINATTIDISGDEVTIDSFLWGKTFCPPEKLLQTTHIVVPNVPPRTTVTVKYLATLGKCSVPFTYTQKDQDIATTTNTYNDGIFHGSNHYNYHFETTLGINPLPAAAAAK